MSNYTDLKNAAGFDASKLATKSHLASVKTEIDKIEVDKIKNFSCWFK